MTPNVRIQGAARLFAQLPWNEVLDRTWDRLHSRSNPCSEFLKLFLGCVWARQDEKADPGGKPMEKHNLELPALSFRRL